MSYQVGLACYSDASAALAAVASEQTGHLINVGSAAYVVDAQVNGTSISYRLADVAGALPDLVYVAQPTLMPCGLLGVADAVGLGWGVVAAWVGAFAILALRKGL